MVVSFVFLRGMTTASSILLLLISAKLTVVVALNLNVNVKQEGATILGTPTRRRNFLASAASCFAATATTTLLSTPSCTWPVLAADDDDGIDAVPKFELRDRQGNKQALIREDYWYMMGKLPPRQLLGPLRGDDPQWNAFGACESAVKGADGGNPCTYVSLNQRIPAYSKYGSSIAYGAKEFQQLGQVLLQIAAVTCNTNGAQEGGGAKEVDLLWEQAAEFVLIPQEPRSLPPPLVDAELKLVLFATAMLTSPNFPIPSRELLVARYYANECHFCSVELARAIVSRKLVRAQQAWDYGRDSWNSYFQVINRTVSAKVGDKFAFIA